MEGVIEQYKDSYYLALRHTQQTIRKEERNWEAWLVFFLKTMAKQKDNLAAKVKEEQALDVGVQGEGDGIFHTTVPPADMLFVFGGVILRIQD